MNDGCQNQGGQGAREEIQEFHFPERGGCRSAQLEPLAARRSPPTRF